MKTILTILKWFSGLFSLPVLFRSLAIGNLSFLFADSVNYLHNLYGINLASLGMMLLLFTFYFCEFVKKFNHLRAGDLHVNKSLKILKGIVLTIALAPIIVNEDFKFVNYQADTLKNIVKSLFEFSKILGAEFIIVICLWLELKLKK